MREKYGRYIRWGVTISSIIIFGVLFFFFIYRIDAVVGLLKKISSVLFPITLGAAIAYLVNPLVTRIDKKIMQLCALFHTPYKLNRFIAKLISITLCLGLLLVGIGLLISMIIPQLYSSVIKLAGDFKIYVNQFYEFINNHLQTNPQLLEYVQDLLDSITNFIYNWVNNELILQVQNVMSSVTVGIFGLAKLATNLVVSLIVSVYLLIGKKKFLGQAKKMLYVIAKPEQANVVLSIFRQVDKIFGGFIIGKLIDSLIIGILCFIGVSILDMPYPLLISVIVGVTNVIPFFGPYIGAIPSAFLILLISPSKFIIFIIFILVLQQIDGNIIGPTILGDSTGLSAFWVIVSILIGGGLFGFLGMLLGVPTFAVIYFLIKTFSEYYLAKKQLPTESFAYIHVEKIDPETGQFVFFEENHNKKLSPDSGLMDALHNVSKKKKEKYSTSNKITEPKEETTSTENKELPQ